MAHQFQILPAAGIVPVQWDACVSRHSNGLIYSRYEYLQHCCPGWHGMIAGDYEGVMALPLRKKFGIRYLYQPPFVQQLGWIGNEAPAELVPTLLQFVSYGDVLFNFGNANLAKQTGGVQKTNLVIDLTQGYEAISASYKKDLVLNLAKAGRSHLRLEPADHISKTIQLYQQLYADRTPHVQQEDYRGFISLCSSLAATGNCFVRRVTDGSGRLAAAGLFLKDEKRVYNVMNSTTSEGRKLEANPFLIDAVIREFAGQPLLFDFEGSDLPGVKSFYEKFGAGNQPYYHWHFNRLPAPLRWLKR